LSDARPLVETGVVAVLEFRFEMDPEEDKPSPDEEVSIAASDLNRSDTDTSLELGTYVAPVSEVGSSGKCQDAKTATSET
jgi:hypothetical protein